ncbi:MAG: SGNH/GDSL hydrolase family protein [Bacteroidota bacterium]
MMSSLQYYLGAALAIPCLPIMAWQGKRIRATVPSLPEADDRVGSIGAGAPVFNLLSLGESTIAGVGVTSQKEGVTGTLAQLLAEQRQCQVDWKVVARSGYTAKRVEQKLLKHIGDFQPDMILLGLGGNDAFMLTGLSKWKRHMDSLLKTLTGRFPDTPIVLTNMPPIKEFPAFSRLIRFFIGNLVELQSDALEGVVQQYPNVWFNSEIIRFDEWLKRYPSDLPKSAFFSDGVHPSGLTYQIWAKDMFRYMQSREILPKNG